MTKLLRNKVAKYSDYCLLRAKYFIMLRKDKYINVKLCTIYIIDEVRGEKIRDVIFPAKFSRRRGIQLLFGRRRRRKDDVSALLQETL